MANNEYSSTEYRDMHFCYGRANGNAEQARRFYTDAYPERRVPHAQTFVNIHRRLGEQGCFRNPRHDNGRPRTTKTVETEERILNAVDANPGTSTRRIAAQEDIGHSTVWEVLNEQLLYPFHIQNVQALSCEDALTRLHMCNQILEKYEENNQLFNVILFTDEAGFNQDGVTNSHNSHVWSDENPHMYAETKHQRRFSLNVWAGMVGDQLIGPHFFNGTLNGETYLQFLQNDLPDLLEDVPLEIRANMWLLQDGAPPHFSLNVRAYLNEAFPEMWIGRAGPVPWAPRSPDLNPMDFFFWGYLKALVYETPVNNIGDLRQRIINGCNVIRNKIGIFHRARRSFLKRLRICIEMNGGHFEHLL